MSLALVGNDKKYYEFIRVLRTHKENSKGFIDQVEISENQQNIYMSKYGKNYYIALENDVPVGWVGVVDNDIRICVDPLHKNKGIGRFMLNELMYRHPTAHAKVLLDNKASQNLFLSCQFIEYDRDDRFIYYKK